MDIEEKIATLENLGHYEVRTVGDEFVIMIVPYSVDLGKWGSPFFTTGVDKDKAINSLYDMIEEQVWLQVGNS